MRGWTAGAEAYRHDGLIRAATIRAALSELGPERAASVIEGLRALNDAWDAVIARDDEGVPQARGRSTG